MKINLLHALLLVSLLFCRALAQAPAQAPGLKIATDEEITEDLKAAPCKNSERLEAVKKFFMKMGATESEILAEKVDGVQNVVLTKKGKTNETVIIGAHYDKVDKGCGAIDNWTGIVIIGNLYRTMRNTDTEKTFVFIAFDKEETGMVGSAVYAKSIPKEKRESYCGMINLDSFGFTYPQVFKEISNYKMTVAAQDLAKDLKMPLNLVSIAGASSDSSPFNEKGIPAITFTALSDNWKNYLHSANDKFENINVSSVRVGYYFLMQYATRLETEACSAFRNK
jgi:Zn-dependent M28 family amino/carboxypeptidase